MSHVVHVCSMCACNCERSLWQARSDTLYCFDFLELLEAGVREQWAAYAKDRPQVKSMLAEGERGRFFLMLLYIIVTVCSIFCRVKE